MAKMNEMSARALTMEELENVKTQVLSQSLFCLLLEMI